MLSFRNLVEKRNEDDLDMTVSRDFNLLKKNQIPKDEMIRFFSQSLIVVCNLNDMGILLNDIKLDNILILLRDNAFEVAFADFSGVTVYHYTNEITALYEAPEFRKLQDTRF